MKGEIWSVLIGILLACSRLAHALPSLDPALQDQVSVGSTQYTLIRDHKLPYKWYYVPNELRLKEDDNGVPEMSILTYVAGNTRQAIIRASVTPAALPAGHESAMRAAAVKWYTLQDGAVAKVLVPQPEQIQLSAIGPLRVSKVHLIQVVPSADGGSVRALNDTADTEDQLVAVKPKTDNPKDPQVIDPQKTEATVPAAGKRVNVTSASSDVRATNLVVPGGQYLTQSTQVVFGVSGVAVDVYEELIRGKKGGLVLYLEGTYEAISVPVELTATLDLKAARSFFKEENRRTSGWRVLCFGNRSDSVETFIRSSDSLNKSLRFEGVKTEDITTSQWDAISAELVKWVTGEIFKVTTEPNPQNGASEAQLPNSTIDLGKFSTLFGLPPLGNLGLEVGYSSGYSHYKFDLKQEVNATARATWRQQTVKTVPLSLSGALSLGNYPDEKIAGLMRNVQPVPLPRLVVRMPLFGDPALAALLDSAVVSVDVGDQKDRQWIHTVGNEAWRYSGADHEIGLYDPDRAKSFPNVLMATFNVGMNTAESVGRLRINRLNTGVSSQEAEVNVAHPIERRADADAVIDFSGITFPLRVLSVDPGALPLAAADSPIRTLIVSFGATGGTLTDPNELSSKPIVFPTFNAASHQPRSLLYAGEISGLRAELNFEDAFRGNISASWLVDPVTIASVQANGGSLTMSLSQFGVREYTLDADWLFGEDVNIKGVLARIEGPADKTYTRMIKASEARHQVTFLTDAPVAGVSFEVYKSDGSSRQVTLSAERLTDFVRTHQIYLTKSLFQ